MGDEHKGGTALRMSCEQKIDDLRPGGLADEPTGNLDEATGAEIIDLLFAGHAQRGTTLVLVTHDAALAARCDRVVRLRSGRIEAAPKRAGAEAHL